MKHLKKFNEELVTNELLEYVDELFLEISDKFDAEYEVSTSLSGSVFVQVNYRLDPLVGSPDEWVRKSEETLEFWQIIDKISKKLPNHTLGISIYRHLTKGSDTGQKDSIYITINEKPNI